MATTKKTASTRTTRTTGATRTTGTTGRTGTTTTTGRTGTTGTTPPTPPTGTTPPTPLTPTTAPTPHILWTRSNSDGKAAAKLEAFRGSGDDILAIAKKHVGERYVLGARAPMANAAWKGPWDCAEFASWCLYQATGILFGTEPRDDAVQADAYTGFWVDQAERAGATIPIADAATIPGAFLLRRPGSNGIGHIVISDGAGATVEAHGSADGVIRGVVTGRRWDFGVLVPGVNYVRSERPIKVVDDVHTLRVTQPPMRGTVVRQLQEMLNSRGFPSGTPDGVYGPQTAHAVQMFQVANGLVADGEAGVKTLDLLGLTLPGVA